MSSQDSFKEILSSIDLESWMDNNGIDYRLTHGSSGEQFNVHHCPECGDDRWKVFMGVESTLGNCFVCDTKFNKYKFIRASLGNPTRRGMFELMRQFAIQDGWRPKRIKSAAVELEKPDLILPDSYELPHNGKNLVYLTSRNIDHDTTKYFHLRYCVKGWFKYFLYEKECYQDYSNRVIVPIFDMNGDIVSFQGRDITGTAEKKYLFPPGFASTGKHIYNGHNAHRAKRVVVGEGVFDVMALKIAFDAVTEFRDIVPVGTFGKHLSHGASGEDQLSRFIELKGEGLEEVTFFWDGEPQALADAGEAAMLLRGIGLSANVAILPKGKDPNEVLPEVIYKAYWNALPINAMNMAKLRLGKVSHS